MMAGWHCSEVASDQAALHTCYASVRFCVSVLCIFVRAYMMPRNGSQISSPVVFQQ